MKVLFRQTASDDVVRRFRYYLFTENLPEVALRFRAGVHHTVEFLRQRPFVGPRYYSQKPGLQIYDRGRLQALKQFGSITFSARIHSRLFGLCTQSAT